MVATGIIQMIFDCPGMMKVNHRRQPGVQDQVWMEMGGSMFVFVFCQNNIQFADKMLSRF